MQGKTSIAVNTLHAVQEFMDTNDAALGNLNKSESRRDLDAVEAELSNHAATQSRSKTGAKAARAQRKAARDTLVVDYLRPISSTAATKLAQSPDIGALTLPKNLRTTPQYLAAAETMGEAAAKHADVFIAAGMAPTFVADLAAAADNLRAAEAAQASVVTSRLGATKGLDDAERLAHKVVKQVDAMIEPLIKNDTALLVKWKATKRFAARPGVVALPSTSLTQSGVSSAAPSAPAVPAAPATTNPPTTAGGVGAA